MNSLINRFTCRTTIPHNTTITKVEEPIIKEDTTTTMPTVLAKNYQPIKKRSNKKYIIFKT